MQGVMRGGGEDIGGADRLRRLDPYQDRVGQLLIDEAGAHVQCPPGLTLVATQYETPGPIRRQVDRSQQVGADGVVPQEDPGAARTALRRAIWVDHREGDPFGLPPLEDFLHVQQPIQHVREGENSLSPCTMWTVTAGGRWVVGTWASAWSVTAKASAAGNPPPPVANKGRWR